MEKILKQQIKVLEQLLIIAGILIGLILIKGCNEPDGYVDGKPYRLKETCTKQHEEKETGYHYGWYYKGIGWHWEWQCYGSCTKTVCDEKRIDTIWMENKNSNK